MIPGTYFNKSVCAGVPVPVDVWGAEGVAVVQQRGVDQRVVLRIIHQILQVAQVTVAASDAVPSAVLIQDEHLTGTEPTLETKHIEDRSLYVKKTAQMCLVSAFYQIVVEKLKHFMAF